MGDGRRTWLVPELPVSRTRFDHFTTVEGAMSKRSAIARQLSPSAIAAATRMRRSSE